MLEKNYQLSQIGVGGERRFGQCPKENAHVCVCVCVFWGAGGCSLMHNLSPLVFFRVNMLVLIFAPSVNLRHLIFLFGSIDELTLLNLMMM